MYKAYFYFNGTLQDFQPKHFWREVLAYTFWDGPPLKDAIEA